MIEARFSCIEDGEGSFFYIPETSIVFINVKFTNKTIIDGEYTEAYYLCDVMLSNSNTLKDLRIDIKEIKKDYFPENDSLLEGKYE